MVAFLCGFLFNTFSIVSAILTTPLQPAGTCAHCTCSQRHRLCWQCACSRWPANADRPHDVPSHYRAALWGQSSVWCDDWCTAPPFHWCPGQGPCPIFHSHPPGASSLVAVDFVAKALSFLSLSLCRCAQQGLCRTRAWSEIMKVFYIFINLFVFFFTFLFQFLFFCYSRCIPAGTFARRCCQIAQLLLRQVTSCHTR